MIFRSLRRSCCLLLALTATAACIDKSYDFDKVEPTVTLGGEDLVVPLVNTRPLTVNDLMGAKLQQYLELNDDRTYRLSYDSDLFSVTFDELRDYDTSGPFRRYVDNPISYSFNLFKKPAAITFDEQGEASLDGIVPSTVTLPNLSKTALLSVPRLPNELVDVQSITLSQDSHFDVTISLPDCLFSEGTLIPDFTVDLSEFFESEDAKDGLLHFDTPLDASNGYSVTRSYNLHKVVFDPKDFDPSTHTLMLHASVKVNGKCFFSGLKTNRARYNAAPATSKLLVEVVLRTVDCVAFVGSYDYTVKDVGTSVNIKDMMNSVTDIFETSDLTLQLSDPEILLDVTTNIPIPTRANVDLVARKGNVRYAEIKNILIDFPYAEPGETIRHGIRLAGEAKHEEGIDDVIVDFSRITSRVPDEIMVQATASTLPDRIAEVRFGGTYFIDMQPTLSIPFAFGSATKVTLRDTLDMPAALGRILKDNTVILTGEMTNTLPVKVDFSLVMLNDAGIMVTDEVTQHIDAGGTSILNIPLKNMVEDGITSLTKAVLTFHVQGIENTRPISADDFLQASIQARVPGGYRITF